MLDRFIPSFGSWSYTFLETLRPPQWHAKVRLAVSWVLVDSRVLPRLTGTSTVFGPSYAWVGSESTNAHSL